MHNEFQQQLLKFEGVFPSPNLSTNGAEIVLNEKLRPMLKQMGEKISDKFVITKVLMSLPDEYKRFVSAWESAPDDKQTIDNLVARLLIEE